MRIAPRVFGGLAAVLCLSFAAPVSVHAGACGDADRTGTVTVTDGVRILRSAASLPTLCPRERCDMNVDGDVTVTDGVLALRVAADLDTNVACSAAQIETIFGQAGNFVRGVAPASALAARAAGVGTTTPCTNGGFREDDGTVLTFFDCAEGDFVTNGTIEFFPENENTLSVFFDTTDFVISTGEFNETFGSLTFMLTEVEVVEVSGALDHLSTIVGEYSDEFSGVTLDAEFFITSGRIITTITAGEGFFTNVLVITSTVFSPTLSRVYVDYADGDFDVFTFGPGLCEPCSSGCSNESLECVPCVGQCDNTTARCGIDFDAVECIDGVFGPVGLCEPCINTSDCNTNDGLDCFPCDDNCTGDTKRCGSTRAFVECVDGAY